MRWLQLQRLDKSWGFEMFLQEALIVLDIERNSSLGLFKKTSFGKNN